MGNKAYNFRITSLFDYDILGYFAYLPALVVLTILFYYLDIYNTVYVIAIAVGFMIIQSFIGESKIVNIANTYLYVGVLGNVILLRFRLFNTEYFYITIVLYSIFVLTSAILWSISVSSILNTLKTSHSKSKIIVKAMAILGFFLAVALYLVATKSYLSLSPELFLIILISLIVVGVLLAYDKVFSIEW